MFQLEEQFYQKCFSHIFLNNRWILVIVPRGETKWLLYQLNLKVIPAFVWSKKENCSSLLEKYRIAAFINKKQALTCLWLAIFPQMNILWYACHIIFYAALSLRSSVISYGFDRIHYMNIIIYSLGLISTAGIDALTDDSYWALLMSSTFHSIHFYASLNELHSPILIVHKPKKHRLGACTAKQSTEKERAERASCSLAIS